MTYAGSQCADYSEVQTKAIEKIENETNTTLTAAQSRMVAAFIRGTDEFMSINPRDLELSEVMLIDYSRHPFDFFKQVAVSPGLAQILGFTNCTLDKDDEREEADGCAIYDGGYSTTDIFLSDDLDDASDSLQIPDENLWHSTSNVVHSNSCRGGEAFKAYRTLVHEAGHAVGIAGGKATFLTEDSHPTIPHTVMNYDHRIYIEIDGALEHPLESDCAPYPLDIMAIYSLYQTSQ